MQCRTILAILTLLTLLLGPAWSLSSTAHFSDAEGVEVQVIKPFARIISLYPAHTENLISLGAKESLIGVSTSDNEEQPELQGKPKFSYHDNTEKFLAAAPDLIIIRPMISRSQPELIAQLRQAGITVVSLQPTRIEEMFTYWQQLAQLTGREQQGKNMVEQFKKHVTLFGQVIQADVERRPKVYFESIHDKMKTFSPDAIAMFALEAAGGVNVAGDAVGRNNSNIAPYGKERLLSHGDEIDVFVSQVGRMNPISLQDIFSEPGFQLIKAVRENKVFLIDEETVSRPTLRLLQGIAALQAFLYPQSAQSTELVTYENTP